MIDTEFPMLSRFMMQNKTAEYQVIMHDNDCLTGTITSWGECGVYIRTTETITTMEGDDLEEVDVFVPASSIKCVARPLR